MKESGMTAKIYYHFEALKDSILDLLEQAVKAGANPTDEIGRGIDLHLPWLVLYFIQCNTRAAKRDRLLLYGDPRFTAYYDRRIVGVLIFMRSGFSLGINLDS